MSEETLDLFGLFTRELFFKGSEPLGVLGNDLLGHRDLVPRTCVIDQPSAKIGEARKLTKISWRRRRADFPIFLPVKPQQVGRDIEPRGVAFPDVANQPCCR